jgi:hypothetical protein
MKETKENVGWVLVKFFKMKRLARGGGQGGIGKVAAATQTVR